MKKSIISSILLILIISILGYYINDAKVQRTNFFVIDNSIKKIVLLNKDFDLYLKNPLSYDNFDIIQTKITSFKAELNKIKNNRILQNIKSNNFEQILENLKITMENKFEMIERIKSYRAILNNSFRIIQKVKTKGVSHNFDNLYTLIMTIDKNPELNIKEEVTKIKNLITPNITKYDKYFLKHAKTILEYQIKFNTINTLLNQLNINIKLGNFTNIYEQYSQNSIKKAQAAVTILFIMLIVSVMLYLIYEYKLIISNKELFRFRRTVESSDNIVVITDTNEKIKYVNEAFTKTTGYTSDEVIGKKPSLLKSGKQPREFYKELQKTIHSGNKWSGEFINMNKARELSYEKASITPVIEDGKIIEFIAIKLDITKETITGQQLKEKEKLLVQQSKMAAMGEMLENIAHQWRQPLSVISTASSGLKVQKELGLPVSKQEDMDVLAKINDTAQYLSKTIDDFRDFFKPNKETVQFNLKDAYLKTLRLVNSKFKTLEIEVHEDLNDIELNNLDGEVIQVIMNILNNARDILETKENQRRLIFVNIYKTNSSAIITIKDNAGGIPLNIIDKIFEPYFTTKHKAQGTGIGLYMSQEMVVKHMNGTLSVENETYDYESKSYTGAKFTMSLSIS